MGARGHRDIFAKDIVWGKGTGEGVDYARFLMDEDDNTSPLVILTKFAPGEVVDPHTHGTNYFEYVVSGEQTVGKTLFGPGDVRFAKAGTGYGPIKIGAEGCTVVIVFQDATGANTIPLGKAKTDAIAEAIAEVDF